jgi:hypothetical protein
MDYQTQLLELDAQKKEIQQKQRFKGFPKTSKNNNQQKVMTSYYQNADTNANSDSRSCHTKEWFSEKVTRINFQKVIIQRELTNLLEKKRNLEVEKVLFIKEFKRIREENK